MDAGNQQIQQAKARFGIIGNAQALTEAVGRALRVAPIDLSVLVTGESGSGKEFFPQIIHAFSPRKHSKYIAVNCGAIPEGTIDSELFGHEKGAFTGAVSSRKGYFEEADGGTIFLDEVAELPLTTQARLLRVLESGEFMKVGSSVVQKTNLRVVAATNVDMEKAVREGRFREDLFYRLSTVQIEVPPLRDRGADIALLARKFAGDFAEKYRVPAITLTEDAREALLHYRWPGNVRQLKNVIEQVALFEGGESVNREVLLRYLPQAATGYSVMAPEGGHGGHSYERERELLFELILRLQNEIAEIRSHMTAQRGGVRGDEPSTAVVVHGHHSELGRIGFSGERRGVAFDSPIAEQPKFVGGNAHSDEPIDVTHSVVSVEGRTLEETERETIRRSLERNGGRRKPTAAELNISERTLYRKIKEFGLE
ncbi:MAG: sigma-54 dependent transcriptional regulator [Muribaculaceae bacterium]|nr:sigma-54 dependent transcriptional regulator [Muribaculaceae bacterium]